MTKPNCNGVKASHILKFLFAWSTLVYIEHMNFQKYKDKILKTKLYPESPYILMFTDMKK